MYKKILRFNIFFSLPVALFASTFFCPSWAEAATINVPPNFLGLVGYWTFDGKDIASNIADISGQGNHGSLSGQISTTTLVGKVGQALTLDGTDDYVLVGERSSLVSAQGTVCGWVKPTGDASDTLFTSIDDAGTTSWSIFLGNGITGFLTNEIITLSITVGGSNVARLGYTTATRTEVYDGNWHHICLTADGSAYLIYLDGVSKTITLGSGSNNGLFTDIGGTKKVYLGAQPPSSFGYTAGAMDEVRVYNRGLTSAEIQKLYNSTSAKFNTTKSPGTLQNGLMGYWTFDGANMTPNVRDISGQGNHGNLSGQTSTTTESGKIGQALRFDGVNDRVNVGIAPSLISDDGTFCSWLKMPADADSSRTLYDATYNVAPSVDVTSVVLGNGAAGAITNELITFYIWTGSANGNVVAYTTPTRSELYDDQWHHICVTADTSYKIYLDGVSKTITVGAGSDNGVFMSSPNLNSISIGGYPQDNVWTKGLVDEARAYNRALSASEVKQLYDMGGQKINTSQGPAQGTLGQSLLAHWTFDGKDMTPNVRDVSGQGNHGNLSHGGSGTTTIAGKIGQALQFDGSNDYFEASSLPETYGNFTMSAWYKSSQTTSTDDQYMFVHSQPGQDQLSLGTTDDASHTDQLRFNLQVNGDSDRVYYATSDIVDTQWHHVVGVRTSTHLLLYVDGVEQLNTADLDAGETIDFTGQSGPYIGDSPGNTEQVNGILDDVRFYNRALSASEVKQLYNLAR